jgi:alkanesulfonate monooxygenase SsuD/methylene tetrahydromethanopterin reductase-like flavin-dependent oxidoreductase (luciferase family)
MRVLRARPHAERPRRCNFSVGEEEFIAGTPESVAEQIIAQCRAIGAGHFLPNFGRGKSPEAMRRNYALFGERVIPLLRAAGV